MKKLRLLALSSVLLASGLMTSCFTDSNSSSVPTIDQVTLDNASLVAGGGTTGIHSSVKSDNAGFSVTFKVTDSTGADASANFDIPFTVPAATATSWSAFNDGAAKIGAKSTAHNGTYTLTETVSSSSGQNTAKATFTVTGGSNPTTTPLTADVPVNIGAQSATDPSFISITAAGWQTITSGSKTPADEALIDVVFFADANGTPTFFSPANAYSLSLGSLGGWSTRNATIIVPSATALTTVEQVKALTDASSSQSATVSANGWYAIKAADGTYGSINITALSGSARSATATIKIYTK